MNFNSKVNSRRPSPYLRSNVFILVTTRLNDCFLFIIFEYLDFARVSENVDSYEPQRWVSV